MNHPWIPIGQQGDGGRQICHGTGGSCDSHCIWTADEYVETATASDEDAEASEEEGEEGSSAASTPLVVAGVAVALAAAVAVATKLGGSTPGAAAGEGEVKDNTEVDTKLKSDFRDPQLRDYISSDSMRYLKFRTDGL